ncbi:hypothetical protein CO659_31095 [Rhizobium sp. S9]|uniref:hypothetical protein n=1 Tax=unclassified Rhizobium TaxID=2613769 RepID=UPI000A21068B|nr:MULTISPECIES: hypothetical protein [unclassified Rhizobium]ARO25010.1 hypothetical protein TAL182_CH03274 [Rhizobium sp. TAL182]PDS94050.1 hypothetical protein CO659_31095 [Rhizobium sp. S9]
MIDTLTALLTPTIAVAVAWISFQQWKTARAKLNLDLFDRRYAVYRGATDALRAIARDGGCKDDEAFGLMLNAWSESQFLFGPDVQEHLDELLDAILTIQSAQHIIEDGQLEKDERSAQVKKKWEGVKRLSKERKHLVGVFEPYMLMDHRRIGTATEWLAERNKIRLSYADEKQR